MTKTYLRKCFILSAVPSRVSSALCRWMDVPKTDEMRGVTVWMRPTGAQS